MGKLLGQDFKPSRSTTLISDASNSAITGKTWLEMDTVADANLDQEKTEIEFATRENGGQNQYFDGPFSESLTLTIAVDSDDTHYGALKDAYVNKKEIALAVTDGPIGTAGTKGYAANFKVLSFPMTLSLSEVATVEVTARPSSFINRDFADTTPQAP